MVVVTNKKRKPTWNPIVDEALSWNDEQNASIPDWHMDELDKTEKRVQKELRENGFIKTYSIEESLKKGTTLIDNFYKRNEI